MPIISHFFFNFSCTLFQLLLRSRYVFLSQFWSVVHISLIWCLFQHSSDYWFPPSRPNSSHHFLTRPLVTFSWYPQFWPFWHFLHANFPSSCTSNANTTHHLAPHQHSLTIARLRYSMLMHHFAFYFTSCIIIIIIITSSDSNLFLNYLSLSYCNHCQVWVFFVCKALQYDRV